jgi:hypothetical protein
VPALLGGLFLSGAAGNALKPAWAWIIAAVLLYALMLPAAPSVERIHLKHSTPYYLLGFLAGLFLVYAAVRFLDGAFGTALGVASFAAVLLMAGSAAGHYVVRRAHRSLRNGFLRSPLNLLLAVLPLLFLVAFGDASSRVPGIFNWYFSTRDVAQFGLPIVFSILAGVWGFWVVEQVESRGLPARLRRTSLFTAIDANLPGIYAGTVFFLIYLVVARALNHPALSLNTVIFESDAGPWLHILGNPEGEALGRAVHPLVLIVVRPVVRLLALFLGHAWQLAPMILVAATSGLTVFLAWIFVLRATTNRTYALLFAILLGSTSTHLLFGSLTETYAFAMASLMFFLILLQAKDAHLRTLVPAGLLVFGVTISNLAQPVIGLLFTGFGVRRIARLLMLILAAGVVLTAITGAVLPSRQTLFFVPTDLVFESQFVRPAHQLPLAGLHQRFELVGRTLLFYGVVAPRPLAVVAHKDPRATLDFKTFDARTGRYASYSGPGNIPLGAWFLLLVGAVFLAATQQRKTGNAGLMLGLLGCLTFSVVLHLYYGTELLLYTPNSTYALVLFVALAYARLAGRAWFEYGVTAFVVLLMFNNLQFLLGMLRTAAPFFAAAY